MDVSKDPGQIIKYLRQKKFQRPQNDKFTVAQDFYEKVVAQINFANCPKSSIEEYKNDIAHSIQEVKDNMDYPRYFTEKFKNSKKAELWKKICDMIDANMILSYNMTEFFPQGAPGGKTEYRVLEHILKNYGKEFVFYVPAVSDDYTSFGSYQFTSLALYDTPDEKR
jgi:cytochrome c-type biogenesis protein CcmH/NrfF